MKTEKHFTQLFKAAFQSCQDLKGQDVLAVDLTHSDSYTDWVLIVSGTSDRQVRAIADSIMEKAYAHCQINPLGVEGYEGALWVLVDFGSVVCHIFLAEVRESYHLEDMWPRVRPLKEADVVALIAPERAPAKKQRASASKSKKKPTVKKVVVKRRVGVKKKAVAR